jgi:acyl-CoA thioester hydrolase
LAEKFRAQIFVRWSDQDINGHVNNARVATLLEEARIKWRRHAASVGTAADLETTTLVASLTLHYRRPIGFGQAVDVDIWVVRIGARSYTMGYAGYQNGHLVLDASTVMVSLDDATGRARGLDAGERNYLKRYLCAEVPV